MNMNVDIYASIAQEVAMKSDTTMVVIQQRTAPSVVESILSM